MKLNLGCGSDIREGYVNVDFRPVDGRVLVQDLSKFPWIFKSESADEILMLDSLEHFPYRLTQTILLECCRVLKFGGKIVLQVPDAAQTMAALVMDGDYLCNRCGARMQDEADTNHENCPRCQQTAEDISEAAVGRFYGGQDYEGNYHYTCFTNHRLRKITESCGFKLVNDESHHEHYVRNWTLRMTFEKADIW